MKAHLTKTALGVCVAMVLALALPSLAVAEDNLPDPAVSPGAGAAASTSLLAYQTLTAPAPNPGPDEYDLDASAMQARWAAVGIRSTASNNDLSYFDDAGLATELGTSTEVSVVDLVAVDFNHLPRGVDYPVVNAVTGTTTYDIEFYPGFATIADDTHTFIRAASDVVVVRDTDLDAGVATYFRVVPEAPDDVDLLLFESDDTMATSLVGGRSTAVAESASGGAGEAESFAYTAGTADTLGLVFTNESATAVNWTLYRDTTAPAVTVVIDGGLATTPSDTVELTLTADDVETGISDMRLCPDGTCDTEVFEPFSTTATVVLDPATPGVRTVAVEVRNGAHMTAIATDDIEVVPATCSGLVATHIGTNGDDTLTGTSGDDVFVSAAGNDTIIGNGGNDTACTGDGDDVVTMGSGEDAVFAGPGADDIRTFGGEDVIRGGDGNDTIRAGSGRDYSFGEEGDDNIIAGGGIDTLSGGNGNDSLNGGAGPDTVLGGAGDDALRGQGADDHISGHDGADIIRGHAGDDVLNGGQQNDMLLAGSGDDELLGGAGDDTLWAGTGADDLQGGPGAADFCHGGADSDADTDVDCEIRSNLP